MAISTVTASKAIEDVEDLAQYGLEDPVCSVTVTAGKTSKLRIGNETGLGGQRYLSLGDGNVYLVDSSLLSSFSYDLYSIIQKESIPSMSDIRSFVVDDGSRQFTIDYLENSGLAYSDRYTWFARTGGRLPHSGHRTCQQLCGTGHRIAVGQMRRLQGHALRTERIWSGRSRCYRHRDVC